MKRFWKDSKGNAPIWAAFLILILFTVSAVVYSGVIIYAKYQTCETEVQRAATVTVDKNMKNTNVRDLVLDVPAESAVESFYVNMTETGWVLEDGCWTRYKNDQLIYSLEDMAVDIEDKTVSISAVLAVSLPWDIGGMGKVRIPLNVRSSVLYIE
jgi:archaellum component FlaF (FlaF/FlaG flagellin family)